MAEYYTGHMEHSIQIMTKAGGPRVCFFFIILNTWVKLVSHSLIPPEEDCFMKIVFFTKLLKWVVLP